MINVTKTFLPPIEEYEAKLKELWASGWVTNNGKFVKELENKLKEKLGIPHIFFCGNGTVVLQMAIKALGLTGEIITTPFSYVATTNSILWEGCTPVFTDISSRDFNMDVTLIEKAITGKTQAILATHVYGNPCDVEIIDQIAAKYNLKVIYDAAHAFGVQYKKRSLLTYGDIATCSFHATKVFHTVEGGSISCHDEILADRIMKYRQFGHIYDDYFTIGINGKNSEFHAAMGICNLVYFDEIVASRKQICGWYTDKLANKIQVPIPLDSTSPNYAYYPVVFESEEVLLEVVKKLNNVEIFPRRYFYPSLNQLPYITNGNPCRVSEDISKRVLSLPLFYQMPEDVAETVIDVILKTI